MKSELHRWAPHPKAPPAKWNQGHIPFCPIKFPASSPLGRIKLLPNRDDLSDLLILFLRLWKLANPKTLTLLVTRATYKYACLILTIRINMPNVPGLFRAPVSALESSKKKQLVLSDKAPVAQTSETRSGCVKGTLTWALEVVLMLKRLLGSILSDNDWVLIINSIDSFISFKCA